MNSFGIAFTGSMLMVVVLFATPTAAYLGLGTERFFLPGSFAVTPLQMVMFCFLQCDAGLVTGPVMSKQTGDRRVPRIVAGMTSTFGMLMALPAIRGTVRDAVPRDGSLAAMQAMLQAQTPVRIQSIAPALAALGVSAGATPMSVVGRRRS